MPIYKVLPQHKQKTQHKKSFSELPSAPLRGSAPLEGSSLSFSSFGFKLGILIYNGCINKMQSSLPLQASYKVRIISLYSWPKLTVQNTQNLLPAAPQPPAREGATLLPSPPRRMFTLSL